MTVAVFVVSTSCAIALSDISTEPATSSNPGNFIFILINLIYLKTLFEAIAFSGLTP